MRSYIFKASAGVLSGMALLVSAAPTLALEAPSQAEALYVWGKRAQGIGTSLSASEGDVSFGAFADRPLLRPGELAEVVPGLAATQHSGSGKANQYFLRGFNLDHGTDFSISLDGAPLNLRTNAHGQGYLDINLLTPELVEDVRYRKGPYFPQSGDFSAAGSAAFRTFDRLAEPFAYVTGGPHAYGRVVAAMDLGEGYVAADLTTSDGPWDRPENLRKGTLTVRQSLGAWRFSAIGYAADWDSTDQVPQRAIEHGLVGRLGTIDTTDGGRTNRIILSAGTQRDDGLEIGLYAQRYRLNLWSNFTYFLDDPVNGDQFEQAETRWMGGGSASKRWATDGDWTWSAGAETRYDHIGKIGLYRTRARQRLSTDREDQVDQISAGAWLAADFARGPLRTSLAVRAEAMGVDIRSDNRLNSGRASDALLSPKFTLAYRVSDRIEVYADAGSSFHSNDARGATASVSPAGAPIDPVDLLIPANGAEVGARYERPGFSMSGTIWALRLESELVYTGDAGDTESSSASRRLGGEMLLNWSATSRLNVDLSAAATRARYRDAPGAARIPNALDYVVTAGAAYRFSSDLRAEVTLRHLGPAPLIEDNTARSSASTVANLLVRKRFRRFDLTAEVLNLLDSRSNDIAYFYTSRLPGEPAAGVDDYHFHPVEPLTFRLGVKATL